MRVIYSSVEQPIPIKEKLVNGFKKIGLLFYECEGLAENKNPQLKDVKFALFERFEYSIDNNNMRKELGEEVIKKGYKVLLQERPEIKKVYSYLFPRKIAIFWIFYEGDCKNFHIYRILMSKKNSILCYKHILSTSSCKELSCWLYGITQKEIHKDFYKESYLKCIDKCLRYYRVPYPGNLDGLVISEDSDKTLILEFSKVKYTTLEEHRKRYKRYFKEDINRWRVLFDFGRLLKTKVKIIWWEPGSENKFMLGELSNIDSPEGLRVIGIFDYKNLFNILINFFKNF